MELLLDPLFRVPFLNGLCLALVLPLFAVMLRLTRQWLAALGIAHVAGAGGVVAGAVGLPALAVAWAAALATGLLKPISLRDDKQQDDNEYFAMLMIAGWTLMLVVSSLSHHAHGVARMVIDGQLYFTHEWHLSAAAALSVISLSLAPRLQKSLLRHQLLPTAATPTGAILLWRVLTLSGIALGTLSLGVMATFAILLIPASIAFRHGNHWRATLLLTVTISLFAYLTGFSLALMTDIPFGPMLTACLLALLILEQLHHRLIRHRR
jgi:zinc/manganese transport system permease protein